MRTLGIVGTVLAAIAAAEILRAPRTRRTKAPARMGQTVQGYIQGRPITIRVLPVGNGQVLQRDAAMAWVNMKAAAALAGIELEAESGWRSNERQAELYREYLAGTGNTAARPGYSDHQAGISMDVKDVGGYESAKYRWLSQNARRFGFTNDVAGEPWHWTYSRS